MQTTLSGTLHSNRTEKNKDGIGTDLSLSSKKLQLSSRTGFQNIERRAVGCSTPLRGYPNAQTLLFLVPRVPSILLLLLASSWGQRVADAHPHPNMDLHKGGVMTAVVVVRKHVVSACSHVWQHGLVPLFACIKLPYRVHEPFATVAYAAVA